MGEVWEFLQRHGYATLFTAVFVEQMGAPIPALPILLAMGAFAGLGHYSFAGMLAAAVAAAVVSDWIWYELGRRKGDSVLGLLCRLSLEPDTCVKRTTGTLDRYGAVTLLFAKFVPGLNTVAPPLAGAARMGLARFFWYDTAGAVAWAGAGLGLGFLFRGQVESMTEWLANFGGFVLMVLGVPLLLYVLLKYQRRRQTLDLLRMERITPQQLRAMLEAGDDVTVVDLRARILVDKSGVVIPGARVMHPADAELHLRDLPRGQHLVFYCT